MSTYIIAINLSVTILEVEQHQVDTYYDRMNQRIIRHQLRRRPNINNNNRLDIEVVTDDPDW